ncbi:MAG: helix-turn-helix transcriptional regulator [Clostridia bacterium]|nr:helix-turn-helix transcriptional regulator [Clostridia bacterium]
MNNTEKFKGQTVGIILFILQSGDRHTDELKELIDSKFSEVKIGTLYSIIARMKTQNLISEYRASSNDGSRRKYYKITNDGAKLYDSDYKELFSDVEPIEQKAVIKETPASQKEESETENVFLEYVKKGSESDFAGDIDFSNVVIEKPTPQPLPEPEIETKPEPLYVSNDEIAVQNEHPVDFDSLVSSEYEYKSVLNKLFPKANSNYDFTEETAVTEAVESETSTDFTDIYEFSERENIKIRTSGDTNRYQGTKILANKLRFHASVITLVLSVLEFLILSLIFASSVPFNGAMLGRIAIIFGAFVAVMFIVYVLDPSSAVKDLPKFINAFEIALVITIATAIITFAVGSINGIDYLNANQVLNGLVLPIVMSVNCPLYVTTVELLSKLDIYHTV